MISSFRPEQFRARDAINLYLSSERIRNPHLPIHRLELEYEIHQWQDFGNINGIELKGMPTLDLALFFDTWPLKIGIELNGEYHRTRTVQDENRNYILSKKWGDIILIDKDMEPAFWETDKDEIQKIVKNHLKPVLKKHKIIHDGFRQAENVPG